MKQKKKARLGDAFFAAVMILWALLCLLPLWIVIASSFSSEQSILTHGYQLWPREFSLVAYRFLFTGDQMGRAYLVSTAVTVLGTLLGLTLTLSLAYPMSRPEFAPRNVYAFLVFFTMLFSGGLVSSYILNVNYLHGKDTLWILIVPQALNAFNVLLMRNFLKTIPTELFESARMDGAGDLRILLRIIIPLAKPSLATIALFYAIGYWNDWFSPMLYENNSRLFPLQLFLRNVDMSINFLPTTPEVRSLFQGLVPRESVRMATCVLATGPIVFVYPFLQRFFVKGLTLGSIRG